MEDKREVSREEGEQFAKDNDYLFAEVSAKDGKGFQDLFYKNLFERIRTKFRPGGQQPPTEVKDIKLTNEQEEKKKVTKKGCC